MQEAGLRLGFKRFKGVMNRWGFSKAKSEVRCMVQQTSALKSLYIIISLTFLNRPRKLYSVFLIKYFKHREKPKEK